VFFTSTIIGEGEEHHRQLKKFMLFKICQSFDIKKTGSGLEKSRIFTKH